MNKFFVALAGWIGDISPTCKQATRLQSQALDGRLSSRQRFGLSTHLCLCKWCRRYGEQLGFIRRAFHECDDKSPEGALPPLSLEARERMKRELEKQSG